MPTPLAQVDLFFRGRLRRAPSGIVFVPGRRVVADARDAQGRGGVLMGVLARGIAVAHAIRPDSRIAVIALDERAKDLFPAGAEPRGGRRWSDLARAAARARGQEGARRLPGLDLVVQGDLRREGGEAASTALAMAYVLAWQRTLDLASGPRALAAAAADLERQCGTPLDVGDDALTLAHGEPGQFVLVDGGKARAYAPPAGSSGAPPAASNAAAPTRVTADRLAEFVAALEQGDGPRFAALLGGVA